jgi:phage terminase Nu1 subunit (DNA packaging protein)
MKEKGELVLTKDVRTEAARLARQVRNLLLIIPARNAARLSVMQDQEDIRTLLQTEIEQALRGLSDG